MLLYSFAFIATNGAEYIAETGGTTTDPKAAKRFPYHCEASAAAKPIGFRVREVE